VARVTTLTAAGPGELVAGVRDPGERRLWRVRLAWVLLLLNVLTFYPQAAMLVPIPGVVGSAITQSSLLAALLVALSVNRPVRVRPTIFLLLLGLLPVQAALISVRAEFLLGAVFRSGRYALFVVVLWLLTPWWDRKDMLLVKTHLTALWVVLGSVLVGLALSPGLAMTDGRLAGVIWPIPWTQVGHYSAMAVGLSIVLWLTGLLRRSVALVALVVGVGMLLLSHTRTALVALVAGVLIAGLSLFLARARVRRAFGVGIAVLSVGAVTVSSAVVTWLARGQDAAQVGELTGRTKVWDAVLAAPRTPFEIVFGTGLSDKSFNGLPIDSNWLATYNDLGLFGATVDALLVLFVLVAAFFRPPGARRAIALFIAVYCLAASFTETSLSDATTYLLELTLAASLVVTPNRRFGRRGSVAV
jgi:hypothetical protein